MWVIPLGTHNLQFTNTKKGPTLETICDPHFWGADPRVDPCVFLVNHSILGNPCDFDPHFPSQLPSSWLSPSLSPILLIFTDRICIMSTYFFPSIEQPQSEWLERGATAQVAPQPLAVVMHGIMKIMNIYMYVCMYIYILYILYIYIHTVYIYIYIL